MSSFSKQLSISVIISYTVSISAWYLYKYYVEYKANKIPTKWKQIGRVEKIILYPLKSGALREVDQAECTELGLREIGQDSKKHLFLDRSLVIYDVQSKKAISLARNPKVTLISVDSIDSDHVILKAPEAENLILDLSYVKTLADRVQITHYGTIFDTLDCGDDAANWLSNYFTNQLGSHRLGYYAENIVQRPDQIGNKLKFNGFSSVYKHWRKNDGGAFADMTSYMILTSPSVEDVNDKLAFDNRISYRNLRANIVVGGCEKYAEDKWKWIKVGEKAVFRTVKLCTRCPTITVNPDTGKKNENREPLQTLKTYRTVMHLTGQELQGSKTVLGINTGLYEPGRIHSGDPVYVDI